eukprot:c29192_g1_i5 orf=1089-2837(-)
MWWFCILVYLLLLQPSAASNSEGNALYAVKQDMKDPDGALSSWNDNLVTPCSSWNFVTCDDQLSVIQVSLANLGLSGVLSAEIGNLPNLQTLTLENNFLSGSLPTQLGNLKKLWTLNASNNSFSGSIPQTLGQLSQLQYLSLSHNKLTGGISDSITSISSLRNLDLSYNNLTGKIPASAFEIPQYNFVGNHLECGSSVQKACQLNSSSSSSSTGRGSSSAKENVGAIAGGVIAEDDLKISFGQLKRFSWRELQVATDNFSEKNVLGQGGFGKVYKGVLGNGTKVAVKRLKDSYLPGGEAAFLREVEMISVAVHRNLLHLIGFCMTASERLLVYPYMANLSVAHCLRERKPGEAGLDWPSRKRIALGAARGLAYLHDHCNPKIIHRDVKAANVLLDEEFEAVVGDFGLAKLVDVRDTHVTTMVRGTMGHIAPEYLSTGKSSEKTDVFGYGVMLLELVTGQRAIDFSRLQEEEDVLLLDHVKKLQHEKRLASIVDPSLQLYNGQEVEEFIQVALLCTQPTPEDRPKMAEVVRMLIGEGLAERWEEWQQVEFIRRQEYDMMPRRLAEWVEDSTVNQEAIELSAGR